MKILLRPKALSGLEPGSPVLTGALSLSVKLCPYSSLQRAINNKLLKRNQIY